MRSGAALQPESNSSIFNLNNCVYAFLRFCLLATTPYLDNSRDWLKKVAISGDGRTLHNSLCHVSDTSDYTFLSFSLFRSFSVTFSFCLFGNLSICPFFSLYLITYLSICLRIFVICLVVNLSIFRSLLPHFYSFSIF